MTGDLRFAFKALPILTTAKALVSAGRLDRAVGKYKEALPIIIGDDFEVPLSGARGGVYSTKYVNMQLWRRVSLMQLCNLIGEVYAKMDMYEEVGSVFCMLILKCLHIDVTLQGITMVS